MDPQHRALHMREQLKQIYRARLPDMGWCDDNTRRKQQVEGTYSQVRGDWEAEASHYQSVAADALEASTTDNEHQTIDMTMPNDRSFWSSSGHPSQVAYEALLYELTGPACKVVSIKLAPYRALYQDGYPVYPPMRLQVWIGASPYNLQPASPWHDVQASDALQTFALWPHAPIGRYLQVRMYGKLQKQREDMKFYTAIRHVDITGTALTAPELLALQPLLHSNTLQLAAPTPAPPASCFDALQAAADYGVGPEQLVGGGGVSGVASKGTQATGQQQHGAQWQWAKLVSRPRVLQMQGQSKLGAGPAQVQQQHLQEQQQRGSAVQRVTAGIRSILGRRGATAAAVAGPSEALPSKKPQQQQQPPPAPPLPGRQQGRQQQQQRQRLPLWLAEEAAAAMLPDPAGVTQQQGQSNAGDMPLPPGGAVGEQGEQLVAQQEQQEGEQAAGRVNDAGIPTQQQDSDHSMADVEQHATVVFQHQQQQLLQQQQLYQQEYQLFRGDDSDQSDGYEEDDSSSDADDDRGYVNPDPEAQQPVGQSALGAAAFEAAQRLTQQIALRLQNVPPWQQEQVLAELLADEPSRGRAGRQAYRQHLADLQAQLRAQQQGEQETAPLLGAARGPPVVAILPGNSSGSGSGCSGRYDSSDWAELPSSGSQQDAEWVVKARVVLDQHIPVAQWFHGESMIESITGVQEDQLRLRQRYSAAVYAAMRAASAAPTHAATVAVAPASADASNSAGGGASLAASEAPSAAAAAVTGPAAAAGGGVAADAAGVVCQRGEVDTEQDAGGLQQQDVDMGGLLGFGDVGTAATTAAAAPKACPPILTAGHLFEWQAPGCWTAISSSMSVGGVGSNGAAFTGSCSSSASVSLSAQRQWLAPASCFCEGWEADVCA